MKGKTVASLLLMLLWGYVQDAVAFYNSSQGRWLNRDPIDEKGGRNLSGFLRNDAVNRFDAMGLRHEPSPYVDRCADPCGYIKEHNLEPTAKGGVVCCKGQKYVCVWDPGGATEATDPKARDIIGACIEAHEREHVPNSRCPGPCSFGWGWPTIARTTGDPFAEHCRIYRMERQCLLDHLPQCGADPDCEAQVQDEIRRVEDEIEKNCALAN